VKQNESAKETYFRTNFHAESIVFNAKDPDPEPVKKKIKKISPRASIKDVQTTGGSLQPSKENIQHFKT
jgi:hypothetical protein